MKSTTSRTVAYTLLIERCLDADTNARFREWEPQRVYTALGLCDWITAAAPRTSELIVAAPSYPCPTRYWKSSFSSFIVFRITSPTFSPVSFGSRTSPSPALVKFNWNASSWTSQKPRKCCLTSPWLSTCLTHRLSCSLLVTSDASSARIVKAGPLSHSIMVRTMLCCIFVLITSISSFWIVGLVYWALARDLSRWRRSSASSALKRSKARRAPSFVSGSPSRVKRPESRWPLRGMFCFPQNTTALAMDSRALRVSSRSCSHWSFSRLLMSRAGFVLDSLKSSAVGTDTVWNTVAVCGNVKSYCSLSAEAQLPVLFSLPVVSRSRARPPATPTLRPPQHSNCHSTRPEHHL